MCLVATSAADPTCTLAAIAPCIASSSGGSAGATAAAVFLAAYVALAIWAVWKHRQGSSRQSEAEREREQHKFNAEALEAYRRFYRIHFPAWLFDVKEEPIPEPEIPADSFKNNSSPRETESPKPFRMPVRIRAELRRDLGPGALALLFAFRELVCSRRAVLSQGVFTVRGIGPDGDVTLHQRTLTDQEVDQVMDEFPITFAQAAAVAGETAMHRAGPLVKAFRQTLKKKLGGCTGSA
ncbi:MAG: hypothetical protein ACP5O1_08015 [Phycisphaerae bacterium]